MLKDTLTIAAMALALFVIENLILITVIVLVVSGVVPHDWPAVAYLFLGAASWPADKYITPKLFDFWHLAKKKLC